MYYTATPEQKSAAKCAECDPNNQEVANPEANGCKPCDKVSIYHLILIGNINYD